MRYPSFLKTGGTIGVPAPSFGAGIEPYKTAFQQACATFAQKGFQVEVGACVYANDGVGISSTPQACGEELTQFYCSPNTDALISCGGGELMCETMDYVDFEAIKAAEPKWFMGFSDNTNFTFTLATMADTASVYGPCAPTFGMKPWHQSLKDALALLKGEKLSVSSYPSYEIESKKDEYHPFEPYSCTEPVVHRMYDEASGTVVPLGGAGAAAALGEAATPAAATTLGEAATPAVAAAPTSPAAQELPLMQGRLLGGCLDILCMQVGTKFDQVASFNSRYASDGVIWFLEACDLNPMSIRRALWQMERAGWFENVHGFLIGRPLCGPEPLMGLDAYQATCGILAKYHVPIILDVDFGHLPPAMPLLCGALAQVSAVGNTLNLSYTLG